MPRLRLDLDRTTFDALASQALAERRAAPYQAEVLLRQALGLPFPFPPSTLEIEPVKPPDRQSDG